MKRAAYKRLFLYPAVGRKIFIEVEERLRAPRGAGISDGGRKAGSGFPKGIILVRGELCGALGSGCISFSRDAQA